RFKPFVAVKFVQQYLYVRISTPKADHGIRYHAKRGHAHKAQPDASNLAPTRTLGSMDSVGSTVQQGANVLQKRMAGRGERDRSLCPFEKFDADLALKSADFLT